MRFGIESDWVAVSENRESPSGNEEVRSATLLKALAVGGVARICSLHLDSGIQLRLYGTGARLFGSLCCRFDLRRLV